MHFPLDAGTFTHAIQAFTLSGQKSVAVTEGAIPYVVNELLGRQPTQGPQFA
jgi:hypothetical protein